VRQIRPGALAVLLCAGLLLAGCGSTHLLAAHSVSAKAPSGEAVIRNWSNTLRRGDVAGAARYFALPSVFANGSGSGVGGLAVVTIHNESQAVIVNSELTCGSVLLSAKRVGKYLNALFRLTNRTGPGADCDGGAGELARVDFLIEHGHIVEWVRAPEAPSGGTAPEPTVPVPTSPTPPDSV
jgi:hypothetical protein